MTRAPTTDVGPAGKERSIEGPRWPRLRETKRKDGQSRDERRREEEETLVRCVGLTSVGLGVGFGGFGGRDVETVRYSGSAGRSTMSKY